MTRVSDSIRRGLEEAVGYAAGGGKRGGYRVHVPVTIDVKSIRATLGMTQEEFASRFGFSVNTLRHWEQGKRQPDGPARAYLLVIERAPRSVQKALRQGGFSRAAGESLTEWASPADEAAFRDL